MNLRLQAILPEIRFRDDLGREYPAWGMEKFGNLYYFKSTNSFSREKLNSSLGSIRNIHYGDIHTKFKAQFDIESENVPFLNADVDVSNLPDNVFCKEGDLVIADASEDYVGIGKTIELLNLESQKVLAGLHTLLARLVSDQIHIGFSAYMMDSWFVRKQIMTIAQGTKVLGISKGRLSEVQVPLPCKEEQQKIALFLSSVDRRIEQLERKKSLFEQYKKGMMQKLFSREIRFRNVQGKEYSDWETKLVGDVFKITRGKVLATSNLKSDSNSDYCYPVYSSQTVNDGLMGYYNAYLFSNAITWTTDGANAGEVKFRYGQFYCTNVCGVLLSGKFSANQCIAEMLDKVTRKYVSYVGNPKLMNKVMANINIYLPSSEEEQRKISDFLFSLDEKTRLFSEQIIKTREFKRGLLEQMFV